MLDAWCQARLSCPGSRVNDASTFGLGSVGTAAVCSPAAHLDGRTRLSGWSRPATQGAALLTPCPAQLPCRAVSCTLHARNLHPQCHVRKGIPSLWWAALGPEFHVLCVGFWPIHSPPQNPSLLSLVVKKSLGFVMRDADGLTNNMGPVSFSTGTGWGWRSWWLTGCCCCCCCFLPPVRAFSFSKHFS